MATRLYPSNAPASNLPFTITQDAGWEQFGAGDTIGLELPLAQRTVAGTFQTDVTVPITTTQDILVVTCVSAPLAAQTIAGTLSLVVLIWESSSTNNCTLAVVAKLIAQNGATKGTLFSNYNSGTEFDTSAGKSTRIINAGALTQTDCAFGDRIVVEIGAHAAAPTGSGVVSMLTGYTANTADWPLTASLTTSPRPNPWVEFSQYLQFLKQPRGTTFSGRFHR